MEENTNSSSWLQGNVYFILRFALVTVACVLIAIALVMMATSARESTRSQEMAVQMVQSEHVADVLLIASFDSSDVPTKIQADAIVDVLNRSGVAVDVEYLDAADPQRGYSSGITLASTASGSSIASKIAEHGPYDCIVCLDDEALVYVESNYTRLFQGVPVVFFGVNDEDAALAAYNAGYATGLVEGYDTADFLNAVVALRPDATNVVVITDGTNTGVGLRKQFADIMDHFPRLSFEFLNASALTRAELGQAVSGLGDSTIVLYQSALTDVDSNGYTTDKTARYLESSSSQPVFSTSFVGVGSGFAGSDYMDYAGVAESAAALVVSVLNGNNPTSTPIQVYKSNGSVFDVQQVEVAGISKSALPANATLIQESGVSVDSVRPILFPILLLLVGVVCIAAFAVLGYKRSSLVTQQIMSQGNMLEQRFYINKVTETPNMQWLTTYASSDAARKVRSIIALSLLGMSTMDDSYGPGTADSVVKQLAERLEGVESLFLVQASDVEFILGMKHDLKLGDDVLERINYIIKQPFDIDGHSIDVKACVAVCNRERVMSLEEMVSGVDIAIGQAIQIGNTDEVIFYDRDLRRAVEDNLEITAELKRAIANEDFYVVYQPQIELSSNKVVGYEALVRMKGEKYPPEEFLAIAELNGQIVDIDRIVSQKVVQQLAKWKRRKQRMRTVTINHALGQLRDKEYVEFMIGLMDRYGLSPSLVCFDLKESLFINNMTSALGFADELKQAGFGISIDGFGAGYMSVQRVMALPAEVVKIDGTLTSSFLLDGDDGVVGNLVRLIHSAGKTVAIEGVETLSEIVMCHALECDIVQGFFFSEPMLPERAVQYSPPEELIGSASAEEPASKGSAAKVEEELIGAAAGEETVEEAAPEETTQETVEETVAEEASEEAVETEEELLGSAALTAGSSEEELLSEDAADVEVDVEMIEHSDEPETDEKADAKPAKKYSAASKKKATKKSEKANE